MNRCIHVATATATTKGRAIDATASKITDLRTHITQIMMWFAHANERWWWWSMDNFLTQLDFEFDFGLNWTPLDIDRGGEREEKSKKKEKKRLVDVFACRNFNLFGTWLGNRKVMSFTLRCDLRKHFTYGRWEMDGVLGGCYWVEHATWLSASDSASISANLQLHLNWNASTKWESTNRNWAPLVLVLVLGSSTNILHHTLWSLTVYKIIKNKNHWWLLFVALLGCVRFLALNACGNFVMGNW